MADINAIDLTAETLESLDGTENVVGFDTAEGKKIPISVLADYTIQKKTQSLGNVTQTLKSAIDAISQKTVESIAIASAADLDTLINPGQYYCNNGTIAQSLTHCPITDPFRMIVLLSNGTATGRIIQIIIQYLGESIWMRSVTNGTGTTWQKLPTRAEMNAVTKTEINETKSFTASTDFSYTNVSITIPANKFYFLRAQCIYQNTMPLKMAITRSQNDSSPYYRNDYGEKDLCHVFGKSGANGITFYIWAQYAASGTNQIALSGWTEG